MSSDPTADIGSVSQQDYGRPETVIIEEEFKALCRVQCTLNEIASYFDCSPATIERWCVKHFKMTFAETFQRFRGKGHTSIRRKQYQKAMEGDSQMLKHLGEMWLGQRSKMDIGGELQPIILKYSLDDEKPKPPPEEKKPE